VFDVRTGRSVHSNFSKKKGSPLLLIFNVYLLLYLPILGSDVVDEGHGVENEKLDGTVIGIEGIQFLRLFDEKLLQYVQFLPHIPAESLDGFHQDGSVAYVFVQLDDFLESFSIGIHLGNLVSEAILVVDCMVHLVLFQSHSLETGRVAVGHGMLVLLVLLAVWFLLGDV
jgi:hypothetical protein